MDPRFFLISLAFVVVVGEYEICRHASIGNFIYTGIRVKVIDEVRMGPVVITLPNDCPPHTVHIGSNVTVCSNDERVTVKVVSKNDAIIDSEPNAMNDIKAVISCFQTLESTL